MNEQERRRKRTDKEWDQWKRRMVNASRALNNLSPVDVKYLAAKALGVRWVEEVR